MHYYKLSFVFLFSILCLQTYSQSNSEVSDITWSEGQNLVKKTKESSIIGKEKGFTYVLKVKRNYYATSSLIVEKYGKNLKLVNTSDIALKEGKRKKFFSGALLSNGKLYIFSSFETLGLNRERTYYKQTLDMESLSLNDDIKKISTLKLKSVTGTFPSSITFKYSNDDSKILAYYQIPNQKSDKVSYGLIVYDEDLTKIYSKRIRLPYSDERYELSDFFVSNKGDIHLLGKVFKEEKYKTRKEKPDYYHLVTSYVDEGASLLKCPIKIEGKKLNDLQMVIDENEELVCGGLYSNSDSFRVDGSFRLKLNHVTSEISEVVYHEFDEGFITQTVKEQRKQPQQGKATKGRGYSGKSKTPRKSNYYSYFISDVLFYDDGSTAIVAEQYFEVVTSSRNSQGDVDHNIRYYHNDIIVVKMSKGGETLWVQKIRKRQESLGYHYALHSSYCLSRYEGKLHFIYNDHPDNLNNTEDSGLKRYVLNKECEVVLASITSDGSISKEVLFDKEAAGVFILPFLGEQTESKETLLFGQNRKEQKLAKVTFK